MRATRNDNPFRLEGPAYVSFSAGETSGFMLAKIVEANGGSLPEGVVALFFNTGKEDSRSLDFVHNVEAQVAPVTWLERPPGGGFRVVTYETAWRSSARLEPDRPFDALIAERGMCPNPVATYCTTELKSRVGKSYMESLGFQDWDAAVGLRADEPARVARQRGRKIEGSWVVHPLADAGVTKADVRSYWDARPFRLGLMPHEGNCDLCFKKSIPKIRRLVEDDPGRATWWVAAEARTGTTFREDRPSYAAVADGVRRQVRMVFVEDDDGCSGFCTE